jgi:hypothetical protein
MKIDSWGLDTAHARSSFQEEIYKGELSAHEGKNIINSFTSSLIKSGKSSRL